MRIFKTLLAIFPLFASACSPSVQAQPDEMAVWGNDMSHRFILENSAESKQALETANKYGNYQNYYPYFCIGNLAFVRGSTPPPPYVMDANGISGNIAIILGKTPRYVALPNAELFAHFMSIVRPNPDLLRLDRRLNVVSLLAGTGEMKSTSSLAWYSESSELRDFVPKDPEWKENGDGTLTISFFTERQSGMTAPVLYWCELHVDSAQAYKLDCNPVR